MGKVNRLILIVVLALLLSSCATIKKAADDVLGRNPSVATLYYDDADVTAYLKELDNRTPTDIDAVKPGAEPGTYIVKRYVLEAALADHVDATLLKQMRDKYASKHKDPTWGSALLTDFADIVIGAALAVWAILAF